jgi:hypothetical protein
LVVTVRTFSINTSLEALTLAPATDAPEVSLTTPEIVLCAAANDASAKTTQTTQYARFIPILHRYFKERLRQLSGRSILQTIDKVNGEFREHA